MKFTGQLSAPFPVLPAFQGKARGEPRRKHASPALSMWATGESSTLEGEEGWPSTPAHLLLSLMGLMSC